MRRPLSLLDLARLAGQMRRDHKLPLHRLRERDRSIGASLGERRASGRLRAWLDQLSPPSKNTHLEITLDFWLAIAALLLGATAMGGFLLGRVEEPINALLFLAVFVGLQLLVLLATLVAAGVFAINPARPPGLSLNPTHWGLHPLRRQLGELAGELRADYFHPLLRLRLLSWGQLFGVFFNLGLVLAFLLVLLVVDRGFGWSSTLTMDARALERLLGWLAAPWAAWWPAATVDGELLAASRYRALQGEFSAADIRIMRAWWPFLLASLLAYGLLPRLVLYGVFQGLYRRALQRAFIHYPGSALVLERMTAPLVHTRGEGREASLTAPGKPPRPRRPGAGPQWFINWAGASPEAEQRAWQLGLQPAQCREAGLDLAGDRHLVEEINAQKDSLEILILIRSWEPPLAELADFLGAIRPSFTCHLLLLPLPGREVRAGEWTDWRFFARHQPHPRLNLLAAGEGDAEETAHER